MARSPGRLIEELERGLSLYDGRHTDLLGRIEAAHGKDPGWCGALLELAADRAGPVRSGAIWLLRDGQRRGQSFTAAGVRLLVALLVQDQHWEQTLNLLQVLDAVPAPASVRERLIAFLFAAAAHEKPLVRAWAISGLIKHAGADGSHRRRVEALVQEAGKSGTAAIRARIRRAYQELEASPPAALVGRSSSAGRRRGA